MGYKTVLSVLMVLVTSQLALLPGQVRGFQQPGWTLIPGKLTWISMGDNGEVWGVNSDQSVFKYVNGGWQSIPGKLVQISVGAMGVWGVNAQNQIWRWNTTRNDWDSIFGALTQVASGAEVWGVNAADEIYKYIPSSNSWTRMPGVLFQISASDGGRVVGINRGGTPYEYKNGGWSVIGNSPPWLLRITVGAAGVWGVRFFTVGNIAGYNEAGSWGTIDGSISQIDSGTYGGVQRLAVVNNYGDIYFIQQ